MFFINIITTLEFLKCLKLEHKIKLTTVSSDYFKEEYFAPRPYSEKLLNSKLKEKNLLYMRDWKTCLAEYSLIFLKELKNI